jgi:hypothetical protein
MIKSDATDRLRQPLAQALAELAGAKVEVTVRMRRSAPARKAA